MEGLIEIILLALVFIGGAVHQSVKASKKRKEHEESGDTHESPLGEAWKELFGGDDPFSFGEEKKPRTVETPTGTKHIRVDPSPTPSQSLNFVDYKIQASEVQDTAIMLSDDDTNLGNKIIEEFDVRKAILYSEIMTPKFKEGEGI